MCNSSGTACEKQRWEKNVSLPVVINRNTVAQLRWTFVINNAIMTTRSGICRWHVASQICHPFVQHSWESCPRKNSVLSQFPQIRYNNSTKVQPGRVLQPKTTHETHRYDLHVFRTKSVIQTFINQLFIDFQPHTIQNHSQKQHTFTYNKNYYIIFFHISLIQTFFQASLCTFIYKYV